MFFLSDKYYFIVKLCCKKVVLCSISMVISHISCISLQDPIQYFPPLGVEVKYPLCEKIKPNYQWRVFTRLTGITSWQQPYSPYLK